MQLQKGNYWNGRKNAKEIERELFWQAGTYYSNKAQKMSNGDEKNNNGRALAAD